MLVTWRGYRNLQIVMWCTLLIGPGFILAGRHDNSRGLIWAGAIIFPLSGWLIFRARPFFAYIIPAKKAQEAKRKVLSAYPHGFLSCEPACGPKLKCYRSKQDLFDILGTKDGEKLQDWKPDDRVIDSIGREYRLVPQPNKKSYDIEPTGETWSSEKLLALAEADARLLKKDADALRARVESAPTDKRIPVLMKAVDEMAPGSIWTVVAVGLFSLLFFFAVYFGLTKVIPWLLKQRG
ncbi:MAG TPA: hypothetical protein VNZ64_14085 [Candidatus Acidoferrum sp.]|nr:hypothetical protein [Candidatus Acidoferrum sp.]